MGQPERPRVTNLWPRYVLDWLMQGSDEDNLTEPDRQLRRAIALDPRMSSVATTLTSTIYPNVDPATLDFAGYQPEDILLQYLNLALQLPYTWDYINSREHLEAPTDRRLLAEAAESFLRVLERHPELVTLYLAPMHPPASRMLVEGKERLDSLIDAAKSIRDSAMRGDFTLAPGVLPERPRKHDVESARERFYVRYLVDFGKKLFGKPLYREVGLLATLCLDLKQEMDRDEVMDLYRRRP